MTRARRYVIGRLASALLASGLLLLHTAARAQAPSPLYPDLRTLPPLFVLLDDEEIDGTDHNILRFTTAIWNAGEGPLELRGETAGDKTLAYQRIYDQAGGVTERLAGQFVFHPDHRHWHFEHFADYELWPKDDFDRWEAGGRQQGRPRWRGSKTTGQGESFCIRDDETVEVELPTPTAPQRYTTCDQSLQGISVGWSDVYGMFLPDQWIDLGESELPDGDYVLRMVADPRNLLHESRDGADPNRDGPRANEAVVTFRVEGPTTQLLP